MRMRDRFVVFAVRNEMPLWDVIIEDNLIDIANCMLRLIHVVADYK